MADTVRDPGGQDTATRAYGAAVRRSTTTVGDRRGRRKARKSWPSACRHTPTHSAPGTASARVRTWMPRSARHQSGWMLTCSTATSGTRTSPCLAMSFSHHASPTTSSSPSTISRATATLLLGSLVSSVLALTSARCRKPATAPPGNRVTRGLRVRDGAPQVPLRMALRAALSQPAFWAASCWNSAAWLRTAPCCNRVSALLQTDTRRVSRLHRTSVCATASS